MLEELYEKKKEYLDGLNIFIGGGEVKVEEIGTERIGVLKKKGEG
ncbi:hypothetical protein [Siminovitchia fortis]|nr:hypothetical protein [Siminovitchia fortis]